MLCNYCGSVFSDNDTKCPNCGAVNTLLVEYEKEFAKVRQGLSDLSKESDKIEQAINEKKFEQEKANEQNEENEENATSNVKLSAICSVVTAIVITVAFQAGLEHSIDFMLIFMIFYILGFIGNVILFSIISGIKDSLIAKLIVCTIFMIIGCAIFAPNKSNDVYSESIYITTTHNTAIESQRQQAIEAIPAGVPCDGMKLEELQSLNWGSKMILTKCRDFEHLRVDHQFWEVKWYNNSGELIGSGIIVHNSNDESDTCLISFKNYTE